MPGFVPIVIVGFIALVAASMIVGAVQAKKRREALAAWAAAHDLRYAREKDRSFDERFSSFKCLRQGDGRYAFNICSGDWGGRRIVAFDYHYETHSTDSKGRRQTHDHYFSAVIVRANLPLKPLLIRAETIFDKIGSVFGFDDIDFESAEFSRRFHVSAADRKWAYDVLHPRAIEFVLGAPRFSVEFDTAHVIAWRGHRRADPAQHEAAIGLVEGLLDRLPDYLRRQQKGVAG